ncbi:MAG: redoxin domain-containing protein [Euryarchaeota archaeon]|nr:redoxin domain-containing protein [Euryarchaeota archaeon]
MKRLVFILLILVFLFPTLLSTASANDEIKAPDFTATDENGAEFSLHDYQGKVVILHFTGVENPLCIECLEEMEGQIHELEKLANFPIRPLSSSIQIKVLSGFTTCIVWERGRLMGFKPLNHSHKMLKLLLMEHGTNQIQIWRMKG